MERIAWIWGGLLAASLLVGCSQNESNNPVQPGIQPTVDSTEIVVISAHLAGPPLVPFASNGDIWTSTWADDDNLYISWGDGGGPGQTDSTMVFGTDAGVAALEGSVPDFTNAGSPFECIRSIHVPDGVGWTGMLSDDDKPSSLLFYGGRLYFAGHTPLGDPDYGYIAY